MFYIGYLNGIMLYDTENFIVLNKPCGLAVHGGSGVRYSILDLLRIYYISYHTGAVIKLVHRLDVDTSGCIIIAKNLFFLRNILTQFKSNTIVKKYHGIVYGEIKNSFIINKPLLSKGNLSCKDALTVIKPLYNFYKLKENYTLVEITPKTGRMHQIRVHLASIRCPLLGDNKYGNYIINRGFRKRGYRRLFLHARSILFNYKNVNFLFCAPYDFFFLKIINYLKKY